MEPSFISLETNLFILQKSIEAGAFLSAFAGLAAALVMFGLTRKFGTGIVATGFRYTAVGVAIIGLAMILEAFLQYLQIRTGSLILVKEILLVIGTYIIVIGTKVTADKLEHLTGKGK